MDFNLVELDQKKRTDDFFEDVRFPSMDLIIAEWVHSSTELKLRMVIDDHYENVGVDLNLVELERRKRTDDCLENIAISGRFVNSDSSHGYADSNRLMHIVYFSLLAGTALNVLPSRQSLSAGGHVSLLFRGLPSPAMFQTSFVLAVSLALSAACGALLVRRDSAVKAFYSYLAALSLAAAAIVLLFSFSSLENL